MAQSVFANSGYTSIENTAESLSNLIAPATVFENAAQIFVAAAIVPVAAPGTLMSTEQITRSLTYPGQDITSTVATGEISLGADTPAQAKILADLLGLSVVNDTRALYFYSGAAVTEVTSLTNTQGTNASVTLSLGGVADATPPLVDLATLDGLSQVVTVIATYQAVTPGAEQINFNVVSMMSGVPNSVFVAAAITPVVAPGTLMTSSQITRSLTYPGQEITSTVAGGEISLGADTAAQAKILADLLGLSAVNHTRPMYFYSGAAVSQITSLTNTAGTNTSVTLSLGGVADATPAMVDLTGVKGLSQVVTVMATYEVITPGAEQINFNVISMMTAV